MNNGHPAMPSGKLRVAIVHSFYSSRQSSGENVVVELQVAALREAGHEVALISQHTDQREQGWGYPIRAAVTVATGRGPSPVEELERFRPDVVHVHNLFPNFGRSWVRGWTGPIVATMHNFRPLCAAATFYRDGNVCTDCLTQRSSWPAVRHACYRDSHLQSLPVAMSARFDSDPLLARAERIVALSDTMADLYVEAGVDRTRVAVLPNFLRSEQSQGAGNGPWIFIGRLVPEKGILELLAEWPTDKPLRVVGDGPLRQRVESEASGTIEVLGERSPRTVRDLMGQACGLVFPSRWFEGFPMVYLEALAAGTPVLAWDPSSVASMVRAHGTGLVVKDLAADIEAAERHFPSLRNHCRVVFEERFSESAWLSSMEDIYRAAVAIADS